MLTIVPLAYLHCSFQNCIMPYSTMVVRSPPVVFVGFQSPGTLGRRLLDGVEKVKLFGEEIAVKAKIVTFQGLSSHADHDPVSYTHLDVYKRQG